MQLIFQLVHGANHAAQAKTEHPAVKPRGLPQFSV